MTKNCWMKSQRHKDKPGGGKEKFEFHENNAGSKKTEPGGKITGTGGCQPKKQSLVNQINADLNAQFDLLDFRSRI